ncbi:CPCC family cysteine-rich protein [Streptomyces luteogriseus]|uniref:CPCC family cysteine-rich protein n=1 Tax=Streptomyces luteogriseus TaxID=68233 RepID=UPI003FA3D58F
MSDSYPCPCCGHRVLDAMPGSYEICPVCFREDDGVQFRWPTMADRANKVSLLARHIAVDRRLPKSAIHRTAESGPGEITPPRAGPARRTAWPCRQYRKSA